MGTKSISWIDRRVQGIREHIFPDQRNVSYIPITCHVRNLYMKGKRRGCEDCITSSKFLQCHNPKQRSNWLICELQWVWTFCDRYKTFTGSAPRIDILRVPMVYKNGCCMSSFTIHCHLLYNCRWLLCNETPRGLKTVIERVPYHNNSYSSLTCRTDTSRYKYYFCPFRTPTCIMLKCLCLTPKKKESIQNML